MGALTVGENVVRVVNACTSLAIGILVLVGLVGCAEAQRRFEYSQVIMGVRARVAVYAKDEESVRPAVRAALAAMNELDEKFSDYRANSELSRLNARAGQGFVPVSRDLADVLIQSQSIAELSEGGFDVTCGPVVKLWRAARKTGQLPEGPELEAAHGVVGWRFVTVAGDPSGGHNAKLDRPGMALDLGGIGKGFAADRGLAILREKGFPRGMVALAGDIAVGDPPPGKSGWRIGLWTGTEEEEEDASDIPAVVVACCGVSTSGDAEQYVEIGGVKYSHIVDPRTGIPLTAPVAATVVAANATTSDALGTAVCVVGPERGMILIEHFGTAAVRIVSRRASVETVSVSTRFPTVEGGTRRACSTSEQPAESIPCRTPITRSVKVERRGTD